MTAEVRLGGDDHARRLLGSTLTWAVERIDADLGVCTVLSGRAESISCAWGWAHEAEWTVAPHLRDRVRDELLAAPAISALAQRLERDPTLPTVFAEDREELDPGVALLLQRLGLSMPLVLVLRSEGRVAGLLLLCRAVDSAVGTGEVINALRRVQQLAEAALDLDAVTVAGPSGPESAGYDLTPRERSITRLVMAGAGNAEIAARLGIAETTVRNHMSRILKKHGVRSRVQLIALRAGTEPDWPDGRVTFDEER